eukprot:TRINITY_DN211_c0_g1_i1.p1 TRINITY_DN211_c0_g1~~TRINITY_DN211_c0_g1_i1.p1  ORF type:complete len:625 (+),score=110.05 TRINITY_DN211_c0_g1_i1:92-1966(+)
MVTGEEFGNGEEKEARSEKHMEGTQYQFFLCAFLLLFVLFCDISLQTIGPYHFFVDNFPVFFMMIALLETLLYLLRVVFAFGNGYIHPDEYFQSPEVMAARLFVSENHFIPWEFQLPSPNRSLMPPFLGSGIPFLFGKWLFKFGLVSRGFLADMLLWSPRLWMVILSLACEVPLRRIFNTCFPSRPQNQQLASVLLHSTWSFVIFSSRTFSNTFEMMFFIILLWSTVGSALSKTRSDIPTMARRGSIIGVCLALGFSSRFTFLFFAFPVIVWWSLVGVFRQNTVYNALATFITQIVSVIMGFAISSSLLIITDSLAFGTMSWSGDGLHGWWSFPPLNNLLYNMDTSNLALHGLHPRWLHALVNAPLFFGILFPLSLLCPVRLVIMFFSPHGMSQMLSSGVFPIFLSIISGIGFLSVAPHQEARFLLPLAPAFAITAVAGLDALRSVIPNISVRRILTFTVLVNILLMIFFGVLHQGGVLMTLRRNGGRLSMEDPEEFAMRQILVFNRTMMPPKFAANSLVGMDKLEILDFETLSIRNARAVLLQACQSPSQVTFVYPELQTMSWLHKYDDIVDLNVLDCAERHVPHVDTESLGDILHTIRSNVFSVEVWKECFSLISCKTRCLQ